MHPNVERALADPIFHREDPAEVEAAIQRLDVQPQAGFKEFYRLYQGGFSSEVTGFELCDLPGADGNRKFTVEALTIQCRQHHRFPNRFLALTDLCGGGILVYDCVTDAVSNVDFEGGSDQLLAGTLPPQWRTFEDFLEEYFTPLDDEGEFAGEYPVGHPGW